MENVRIENNSEDFVWQIYNSQQNDFVVQKQKEQDFINRVRKFAEVNSFEDAKKLASQIIPTKNEKNQFFVGNLNCIIVNQNDLLRISVDSDKEFICYNFER